MDRHCFVIQRFDGERYDQRFFDVIKPIVESCQLMAYRIDQDPAVDNIIETVMEKIRSAALVIAEISTDRPNVWFELGYAMALSKPVIMLCDNTRTEIPFDIRQQNILFYRTGSISDYEQLKRQLRERITVKIGIGNNIQNLTATDISVLKRMAIHQRTENTITPENRITEEAISKDEVLFSLRKLMKLGFLVYFYSSEPNSNFYRITEKAERFLNEINNE